jgi:hypothetical protein
VNVSKREEAKWISDLYKLITGCTKSGYTAEEIGHQPTIGL